MNEERVVKLITCSCNGIQSKCHSIFNCDGMLPHEPPDEIVHAGVTRVGATKVFRTRPLAWHSSAILAWCPFSCGNRNHHLYPLRASSRESRSSAASPTADLKGQDRTYTAHCEFDASYCVKARRKVTLLGSLAARDRQWPTSRDLIFHLKTPWPDTNQSIERTSKN